MQCSVARDEGSLPHLVPVHCRRGRCWERTWHTDVDKVAGTLPSKGELPNHLSMMLVLATSIIWRCTWAATRVSMTLYVSRPLSFGVGTCFCLPPG